MPADYTVRINGVDRAETHVLLDGFKINEITNGINTLVCEVESSDASYRPVKRQTIEVEEDDGTSPVRLIFGGVIRMVRERGLGMTANGDNQIVQAVSADSYETLASRRFVTETFASQSLRTTFTSIVNTYLAAYGVTVDPGMAAGPTLEALDFKVVRVDDVFNFLATQSAKYGAPFTWKIDYEKIAGMYQTGTVAAPWNVIESSFTDGNETTFGDIEVEPTDDNYANKIIVVWGSGNVATHTDSFLGNGVQVTFPLTYAVVGPNAPGPAPNGSGNSVARGYVTHAGIFETLDEPGNGATWEYDVTTNSITKVIGPAPAVGASIIITYDGLITGTVTAQNASEIAANGLWEDKILAPEIETEALAQAVADAELARRVNTGRIVRFRTRRMPAPQPGETITITVPKRNITGSFTVTDVATENDPGNANTLYRTVTCNSSIHEQSHQTLTRWWSEKDHAGIAMPAGASGVPDWPLNSVQFNDNWFFGGAAHVLYGDLFYSQPDLFTSPPEVQSKGLIFVQNQDIGDAGHIGLDDPQRLEMGMIGEGDFSMDMFGTDASILINATGDINITAGVPETSPGSPGSGLGGVVAINGNASITEYVAALSGAPIACQFLPLPFGDSFSRLSNLTVVDGVCGTYQTISAFPYTINTTTASDTVEFTAFICTGGAGTVFLPSIAAGQYRVFPITATGRTWWIVNAHASASVTLDANTVGGTTINGDNSITLGPESGVKIIRHDTGYKIIASHGVITGGGAATATPGGNDKDVQFNDGGVFGGESAFEYDKTLDQVKLTSGTGYSNIQLCDAGNASMIELKSISADLYADVTFGRERLNFIDTARTYAPAYLWFQNAGGSGASPDRDAIGIEINPDEDPGSTMTFAKGRGIDIDANGAANLYQYGGLGSGNPGMGLTIDNNTTGAGAPGWLGLKNQDDTPYYEWPDQEGFPHWGDFTPSEGSSPSPADSNFMTIGNVPEMHLIVKEADESVANNTLQDDDEFWFNVNANELWQFEMLLFFTTGTSTTPDFQYGFTLPTGATITYGSENLADSATAITGTQFFYGVYQSAGGSAQGSGGVLSTATIGATPAFLKGIIRTSSTAGIVQFRWSQLTTTGGTPTVLKADSYWKRIRVKQQ